MWKYTTKKVCNDYLLSLFSFDLISSNQETLKLLYKISNNKEKYYHVSKIKKKSGGYRTIYQPSPTLKYIQKTILDKVLKENGISKYAKAYYNGANLIANAKPHLNQKIILKLDIKNFFPSTNYLTIYKACFTKELYPKSIGTLFTSLCTYEDFLPQGSITAPYISNLVLKDFDNDIGTFCQKRNINYTRYCDDMTFSGNFDPHSIIKYVANKLYKIGYELNKKKIHIITNNKRQEVTGIVVNKKLQVPKDYRHKIRQELYYITKYSLNSHLERNNIKDKEPYLQSLYGKILYALQIDPSNKEFIKYKELISLELNKM